MAVGSRVRVPVRTRLLLATVVELLAETAVEGVKPIAEVLGAKPLINPALIQLGHWIASYYCCAPHVALRAILPQVVRNAEMKEKTRLFARLAEKPDAGGAGRAGPARPQAGGGAGISRRPRGARGRDGSHAGMRRDPRHPGNDAEHGLIAAGKAGGAARPIPRRHLPACAATSS